MTAWECGRCGAHGDTIEVHACPVPVDMAAEIGLGDVPGTLVAAGGWYVPTQFAWDEFTRPAWASDLYSLAYKWEKKARKLQKRERRYQKKYRSTGKVETLMWCAKKLKDEADRLGKEWPVGSVNERRPDPPIALPDIGAVRGGVQFGWTETEGEP